MWLAASSWRVGLANSQAALVLQEKAGGSRQPHWDCLQDVRHQSSASSGYPSPTPFYVFLSAKASKGWQVTVEILQKRITSLSSWRRFMGTGSIKTKCVNPGFWIKKMKWLHYQTMVAFFQCTTADPFLAMPRVNQKNASLAKLYRAIIFSSVLICKLSG